MKHATFLMSTLLAVSLAGPTLAAPAATTAWSRLRAMRALDHSDPAEWQVSWDEKTGTPEMVFGSRSRPLAPAAGGMAVAARNFLLEHGDLFRLRAGLDDLAHSRTVEMSGVRHIHLEQTYRGLPVLDAGYNVAVDAADRIVMVTGSAQPDLEGDVTATIPAEAAGRLACATEAGGRLEERSTIRLAVHVDGTSATPVYEVLVRSGDLSRSARVLVDARTGRIVEASDRTLKANWAFQNPPYPYGPWTPHGSSPQTVSLSRLNGDGLHLQGQYINVHNGAGSDIVASSSGNFGAYPDTSASDSLDFAQVHAYYWADGFMAYVHSLGYSDTTRLDVYVNVQSPVISDFIPGYGARLGRGLHFTTGHVNPNAAYDANMIVHEAQHFVTGKLGYTSASPAGHVTEYGALQEGISEYLASSYGNDPLYAPYVVDIQADSCDGANYIPYHSNRTLASDSNVVNMQHYNPPSLPPNYPQPFFDVCGLFAAEDHTNGLIVAGALWDLRSRIGASTTDQLVLAAIPYLPVFPTLACFFEALIEVDNTLNSGVNLLQILRAQYGRGLKCRPIVDVSGAVTIYTGQTMTYSAQANSGNCPALEWRLWAWQRRPHHADPQSAWTSYYPDDIDHYITTESTPNQFDLRGRLRAGSGFNDSTSIMFVRCYTLMTVGAISGTPSPVNLNSCPSLEWNSSVSGGHAPLTYVWKDHNTPWSGATSANFTPSAYAFPAGSHTLTVTVTDVDGQQVTSPALSVTASGSCGEGSATRVPDPDYDVVPRRKGPGSGTGVMLAVPVLTHATLEVCDIAGRRVATAFDGELSPGSHDLQWESRGIPSGVYFYRLKTPAKSVVRRFALIH